ncbi:TPA: ATP-dependent Clp protease proteolytic subunit, partial [Listeria monocytogenes]|nr:ATP-dependent Clp protease proteolytic subunit [Listeria monocytogenes]
MKLEIKGTIISNNQKWIYDMLDMESTSPRDIVLPENNESIDVIINSGGGDVYAGSEIYTTLKGYNGTVNVKVVGIAASAASVIAMAG